MASTYCWMVDVLGGSSGLAEDTIVLPFSAWVAKSSVQKIGDWIVMGANGLDVAMGRNFEQVYLAYLAHPMRALAKTFVQRAEKLPRGNDYCNRPVF